MKVRLRRSPEAARLRREQHVFPACSIRFLPSSIPGVILFHVPGQIHARLEPMALQMLAEDLGIPWRFVQSLVRSRWGRNLLCDNLNVIIKEDVGADVRFLVRVVGGRVQTVERNRGLPESAYYPRRMRIVRRLESA